MKKLFIIIGIMIAATAAITAQPSWTKRAAKSVFTLKTFAADGTLIASATGVFTTDDGTAISAFTPFAGAQRAVVIDAQGKEWPVTAMLGANETYDVARFRVAAKKTQPLTLAGRADEGDNVYLLTYRDTKSSRQGTVRRAEPFNEYYRYYTVDMTAPDNSLGAPLMNSQGELVGLLQQPAREGDTLSYAVSATLADSLHISGLSLNDATLRKTAIKKDLPATLEQAQVTMFMAESTLDSAAYATLVDDFIAKFPTAPDGYVYRAQLLTARQRFDEASRDMEQAINVADSKDEPHFSYSKLIYNKELYLTDAPYPAWTLDKALDEARQAEAINPLAAYRRQQAVVLYAQKKYREAYDVYTTLFASELRSPDLFFEASRCLQQLSDSTGVLAMLDSCVAMFSRPYLKEAAPYLLMRAQTRMDYGQMRSAMADLNDYEQLMAASVNDKFYYLRHQVGVASRQFQQALNDIDRAITLSPRNDLYYSEKASLQVRVGLYDDAITTARQCIDVAPTHSDGYLFLGLAQCLKGQKAEGVKNLQRAHELGDEQAASLIEQYGR